MSDWFEFPYENDEYLYEGDQLAEYWARLHEGDREPFPDAAWVRQVDQEHGILGDLDPEEAAESLQDAWRAYHCGDFQRASELGHSLGFLGNYVAAKAEGIHAVYLQEDEKSRLACFGEIAEACEAAAEAMPTHANSHYFRAFALGRFSQGISVAKALKQGMGGKIRSSLERALELEPGHADAHTAMGLYHAEIIDKVGSMLGSLTYGANSDEAQEHFQQALEAAPNSAIARIEYANGLLLLRGDKALDDASELYVQASEMQAADAMERLDVELALSELE